MPWLGTIASALTDDVRSMPRPAGTIAAPAALAPRSPRAPVKRRRLRRRVDCAELILETSPTLHRGENVATPGVVSQWQNGEFEVVWPPDRATAPALFPKPSWN